MVRAGPIVCLLLTGCTSSMFEHTPHPTVRGQSGHVKALYWRMGEYIRARYWKKSEKEFWTLVSRNGPLDRNRDAHIFFDAFTKPIDRVYAGNRDMSSGPFLHELEQLDDSRYEILNPGHSSFLIARLDLRALSAEPGFHFHHEREEHFFSELPPSEYLLAGYGIQGEGYVPQLVVVLWTREADTWMVWNILVRDFSSEEEARLPPFYLSTVSGFSSYRYVRQ